MRLLSVTTLGFFQNKMAFVALITLLEEKVRKAPFMMFIRRFILVAADRVHEKVR